jgi:hypothetical protein
VTTFSEREYVLPPHTVLLVDTASGSVAFNTSDVPSAPPEPPPSSSAASTWEYWPEDSGGAGCNRTAVATGSPIEMLSLTEDDTDYCWYTTNVSADILHRHSPPQVEVKGIDGTIVYAFLDGSPATAAAEKSTVPNTSSTELQILAAAMGIPNGGDTPQTSKGLASVRVNGVELVSGADELQRTWRHSWMMRGETLRLFSAEGTQSVPWRVLPATGAVGDIPHVWFRAYIDLPRASAGASQTSYALNLTTMNKGVAYVNGFNLGRYWLVKGQCKGACAPPVKDGHCYMHWKGCDRPTQTLYHIPNELLQPKANLVVLFEETANSVQRRDLRRVEIVSLHQHPA